MRFKERLSNAQGDLVFLSRGTHEGTPTWHYVKVEKRRLPMFRRQAASGTIDVAEFGEVLFSGWGEYPPAAITKRVKAMFGVKEGG